MNTNVESGRSVDNEQNMQDLIIKIPKVELHAHLNGCIRETTLFELAMERNVVLNEHHFVEESRNTEDHSMYNVRPRSLQDCFEMFEEIPKCVDDLVSLARITMEAFQDFAGHNVAYLELRSTPKRLYVKSGSSEMADKRDYCTTIIECMQRFEEGEIARFAAHTAEGGVPRLPMVCRLIVAIDRSQSIKDANEHVELAKTLSKDFGDRVVGVDLGGNPTKNHFNDFKTAFERARTSGLRITLHCAEVPCNDDDPTTQVAYNEAKSILEFRPDRVGHALLLPPSLQQLLLKMKIPVESCPTSNVMTLELAKHYSGSLLDGLKGHPQLHSWIANNHPLSINTDDPGVFNTSPTKELMLTAKAFGVNGSRLGEMVIRSMDHAFCNEETRKIVLDRIRNDVAKLLQ